MSRRRFADGPPRMRRKLPLALSGEFGTLAGEAWWMDRAEVVFWCVEKLAPGTLAELRIEMGLLDEDATLPVEVTELLDRPEIKLRSGYLHTARFVDASADAVKLVVERMGSGDPSTGDHTERSSATSVLPRPLDEGSDRDSSLPSEVSGVQTDVVDSISGPPARERGPGMTLPEDVSGSAEERRHKPRGRRLISRALARARTSGTRTESGGRRPIHVAEPSSGPSPDRPLQATVAPGKPPSLLLRFHDMATMKAWLEIDDDRVRLTVAPIPEHNSGERFLVVLQLVDATYVQFHGHLARQRDYGTEFLSDRLSFGTLHPLRASLEESEG